MQQGNANSYSFVNSVLSKNLTADEFYGIRIKMKEMTIIKYNMAICHQPYY